MLNKENRIREEVHISPKGKKYKGFIHKCHNCDREMFKTKYNESKSLGLCKFCIIKKTRTKIKIKLNNKVCKSCKRDLDIKLFGLTGNGHYRSSCYKCYNLKHVFNISFEEYEQMLSKQDGKCAICNEKETIKQKTGKVRSLSIDHCHTTGKVRGLLCTNCNGGLGFFKDNKKLLRNAIKYLKENEN